MTDWQQGELEIAGGKLGELEIVGGKLREQSVGEGRRRFGGNSGAVYVILRAELSRQHAPGRQMGPADWLHRGRGSSEGYMKAQNGQVQGGIQQVCRIDGLTMGPRPFGFRPFGWLGFR
jgi:hypothetical protein